MYLLFWADMIAWLMYLLFWADIIVWSMYLLFWADIIAWSMYLLFWADMIAWSMYLLFWADIIACMGLKNIIPTIMIGKIEMEFPAIHMMKKFIGICLRGPNAMSHDLCKN